MLTCTKRAGGTRSTTASTLLSGSPSSARAAIIARAGMDGLSPIFGVDFTVEEQAMPLEDRALPWAQDDVEIVDHSDDAHEGRVVA